MRHLPVWFVTEPPGGPRSNPASYYRAGTRTRTVPRQKLGALSVELGGYRKRTEDRRQTTDDRRHRSHSSSVFRPPSFEWSCGRDSNPHQRALQARPLPFRSPQHEFGSWSRTRTRIATFRASHRAIRVAEERHLHARCRTPRHPAAAAHALLQTEMLTRLPPTKPGGRHPRYAAIALRVFMGPLQCPAQSPQNQKGENPAHTVGRSNAPRPGTHTGGRSNPARHDMTACSAPHTG